MFNKNKPTSINTQGQTSEDQRGMAGDHHARRQSLDTGISPTYYHDGDPVSTTAQQSSFASPVYDDASRVFFSHHKSCSCKFPSSSPAMTDKRYDFL
ncbi:hypothetical protein [Absidia glauca]|uniref:Uncharacterized protein n=1 Tax=Absidia glauca TaxID=4829 RepID=A0A163IXD2_ABSGL|nr:hypothetical protein [Absidia glauca]